MSNLCNLWIEQLYDLFTHSLYLIYKFLRTLSRVKGSLVIDRQIKLEMLNMRDAMTIALILTSQRWSRC